MINFARFFINNSVVLILTVFIFTVGGLISFFSLKRNEDPGFKIRTASIITEMDGFCAQKIDNYITRPIENILLEMEEIEDIKEESNSGRSVIYADLYETYDNIQPIWDRLRRKVELARNYIPKGATPVVNDEFADVYGTLIGISINEDNYEKLYDTTELIRDEFLKLKSRGKVDIIGKQDEVVYLYLKNSYFSNLQLTPDILAGFMDASNLISGGGSFSTDKNYIEINPDGGFKTPDDIKKTTINIKSNPLLAQDIFKIEKTTKKPVSKLVRSNGKDALILAISLKKDGNILKLGDEIKKLVFKLKEKYKNVNIDILAFQSDYVKKLTDKFTSSLYESIFAVILTVLIILGAKTGLITGFIILATVSSVFLVMKIFNIGLDKISLSALIISLGILVDNSIVIAESSLRTTYDSVDKIKEFIISTAGKFQTPLFVATLNTSLSFLPVFIAKSAVGEYASNLFVVVFITLLFSWFYSVTLLPYLMFKFANKDILKKRELFLINFIKDKISLSLKYPKTAVLIGSAFFLFSIILFLFVPKIFFPDSDRNMFEIRLNLKNGTSFEETKRVTLTVEDYLKNNPDITNFSSYIGTSAPRYVLSAAPEADKINFSMILVNTKNYKTVNKNIAQTKNFINKNIPSAQAVVRKIPLGPPVDAPVEVRIINNNLDELFILADRVSFELSKIKGVYLVKNNWGDFVLEYKIKVNENAAIMAGFSPFYLLDYLNTYYNGKVLTYYYRGDIKIPVILKGEDKDTDFSGSINNISLYSPKLNRIIPLNQAAQIIPDFTYSKILRRNNSYVLTVQAWVEENVTADKVVDEITPKLNKIDNLEYEFGGIEEKSKKGNKSVTEKIPAAFLVMFFILTIYFNDIKKPLLIMFCAILALSGANFGLFITRLDFGFITFLGYICLVGICANNGVILLSEIKGNKKEEIEEAAKSRVEPVLLTCLTTIGGMLPLWLKNDPMFSTLGVAVIFGLLTSILITLLILPSLYYLSFLNKE